MKKIRILIADDHPIFRFGLRMLLAAESDMEVVGEATSGPEAVALAHSLEPEVILMDINLPNLNGIEATRQIIQAHPATAILVITMLEDNLVFSAIRAGARGFLLKGSEGETTLRAIRAVAAGEAIFSPTIAQQLTQFFSNTSASTTLPFPDLTPREHEILKMIAQGYTNAAITEQLVLSPKTVRNQVSAIFSKLKVSGRAQAIVCAREAGLG